MLKKEMLLQEIENMPEDIIQETVDFLRFLKQKKRVDRLETAIASESSLAKDWMKAAEDKAWENL